MNSISFKNVIFVDPDSLLDPNSDDPEIREQFEKIYTELRTCSQADDINKVDDINFRSNWITEYELEKLSEVLGPYINLTYLDLDYNRIDASAIKHLKKIIIEHPSLKHISLNNNKINDKAIENLLTDDDPKYLERLNSIEIKLYDNAITEKGIELAFGKVSLGTLSSALAYNKVNTEIKEKKELLESNQSPPLLYSALVAGKEFKEHKTKTSESKGSPNPAGF